MKAQDPYEQVATICSATQMGISTFNQKDSLNLLSLNKYLHARLSLWLLKPRYKGRLAMLVPRISSPALVRATRYLSIREYRSLCFTYDEGRDVM